MPPPDEQPITFDDVVAEELKALLGPSGDADASPAQLTALCISGGGIRSATFGLGVLQGLADQGVLGEFDYLSTVSGGGYIGGWLTAWKQRAGGLDKILPKLRTGGPAPEPGEIDPIGYLREYNNYLSPRLGFLSADTWTLGTTVILNMALNWLVIVPLLLFALMMPRLILSLGLLGDLHQALIPAYLALPLRIAASGLFTVSIVNAMRYLPSVGRTNHTEKDFLKYCLTPLILGAVAFMTYDSWFDPYMPGPKSPTFVQMLVWITGACVAGWLGYIVFYADNLKSRVQLLFGPISLGILLTGIGMSSAAWLLVNKAYLRGDWAGYTTQGLPLLLLSFLAAGGLFIGLTSRKLADEDREWLARSAAWTLLFVVCWFCICGLVLMVPALVFPLGAKINSSIAAAGGLAGWLCAIAGMTSPSIPSNGDTRKQPSVLGAAKDLASKMAAPVFVVVLLVALAIGTNWLLAALHLESEDWYSHESLLEYTESYVVAGMALAFLIVGQLAARYININKFSLHGMYRNRLIRAYLGASNDRSKANQFIGFSQTDNIRMADLQPELKPFHIVNVTLNLVAGKRLAWQQRKAESFTISSLHSGSSRLGYRPSREYGSRHGISLGTAITISGAAASPNMGYHSAGVIGFIMTLFNARLGAWMGNPGTAGAQTWKKDGPSSAVSSLVKEAFGLTDDSSDYVYLSDGGHFENLGLYEMAARRCKRIVVLDSGCDPGFVYEDLGNALRKIRIDMGIPIDFEDALLKPLRDKERRCALATIRYSSVNPNLKDGVLLYIKPMILDNEPPDVATYHASHKDFPHQSTGNQWYDESQTESYRMLGLHTVHEMCTGWRGTGGLDGVLDHLRHAYLEEGKSFTAGAGTL